MPSANLENQTFTHHSTFFFKDGDVFVVAQTTLFFLHSHVLARHSGFFRDFFNSRKHEIRSVSKGGVPVWLDGPPTVQLQSTARQVEYLLTAIYSGPEVIFSNSSELLKFSAILDLLQLGKEYGVAKLQHEVLHQLLQALWPSWFSRFVTQRSPSVDGITIYSPIQLQPIDYMDVLFLARALRLPQIVVLAYYHCCSLPTDLLQLGQEKGLLSSKDLDVIAKGTEHLIDADVRNLNGLYERDTSESCQTQDSCCRAMSAIIEKLRHKSSVGSPFPLANANMWLHMQFNGDDVTGTKFNLKLCNHCIAHIKKRYALAQLDTLTHLGGFFGMPGQKCVNESLIAELRSSLDSRL